MINDKIYQRDQTSGTNLIAPIWGRGLRNISELTPRFKFGNTGRDVIRDQTIITFIN